jgi:hypothetical protein
MGNRPGWLDGFASMRISVFNRMHPKVIGEYVSWMSGKHEAHRKVFSSLKIEFESFHQCLIFLMLDKVTWIYFYFCNGIKINDIELAECRP